MREKLGEKLIYILLALCFFLAQVKLCPAIAIGGITPNLLIVFVVSVAFVCDRLHGMVFGAACGLMLDIYRGPYYGVYMLIFLMIGYLVGSVGDAYYNEDIRMPLILVSAADLGYGLCVFILFFLFRGKFHLPYYLTHIMIPEAVYTAVLTLLVYPLIEWINRMLTEMKNRRTSDFVE